jgi:cytochrome c oxidase assembly protein subunit 11
MSRPEPSARPVRRAHLRMFGKLALLAALMFGFGFALVPIYKAICEITGVGLLTTKDERAEEFARNTQVDTSRTVVVEFDANSRGPWQFKPERSSVQVHPGELVTIVYELVNNEPRRMAGQAIPSYAPLNSAAYFHKLECFCFKQQDLDANEAKKFPVVFVVDPKLPADVNTITLSYTFFEVGAKSASAARPGV